jgi:hypothetical protein
MLDLELRVEFSLLRYCHQTPQQIQRTQAITMRMDLE